MDFNGNQTVQGPKDILNSFIFKNKFEQESHKRASQNRARRPFELLKLKLCYFFFKWAIVSFDKTLIHHLESFKALWTVCSLHWNCLLNLEPFGSHWSPLYGEKSWKVFIKNLNFFSTEERMTWIYWMTWGWVNYQQKFFWKVNYSFKKSSFHKNCFQHWWS